GLLHAGIEPILHFSGKPEDAVSIPEMKIFLDSYAKWGVHYVVFFDRPNSRSTWSAAAWAQEALVERFVDKFIPLAEAAVQAGLTPVFSPLEPGGDYWDTAFLSSALQSMQRRKQTAILDNLAISAYAWTGAHSLNWGAGGPERWPGSRPYFTPNTEEDQRGFRIFDWYLAISRSVVSHTCPILLFGAGSSLDHRALPAPSITPVVHAQTLLNVGRLLANEKVVDPSNSDSVFDAIPDAVVACNFWLLAADTKSPYSKQALFQPDGQALAAVGAFRQWISSRTDIAMKKVVHNHTADQVIHPPIAHYLLLPKYDWGVADWHLEIIRPFVKKHHPTIGFSIEEAEHAAKVTVIGGPQAYSEEAINHLRQVGCYVERISGDGTTIATILAER
ncbi:MAG: hypothetical protein PHQ40_14280, partial [Anaerolineaceae bacterium]|nr:hypothetical protein [Anaerolineaceae bacterium]